MNTKTGGHTPCVLMASAAHLQAARIQGFHLGPTTPDTTSHTHRTTHNEASNQNIVVIHYQPTNNGLRATVDLSHIETWLHRAGAARQRAFQSFPSTHFNVCIAGLLFLSVGQLRRVRSALQLCPRTSTNAVNRSLSNVLAFFVAADAQSDLGVQLEFKNLTLVSPREHASLLRALPSGNELRSCVITTFQSFKHCSLAN